MGRQKFAARLEQYLKSNFEKYHLSGINEAANDQKISNFNFSILNTCSIELKPLLNETTSKTWANIWYSSSYPIKRTLVHTFQPIAI